MAGFVALEGANMTQTLLLQAGRGEEGSAAEEEGWSNKEKQWRRRRWRAEDLGGFGKVFLLGQAAAGAGGDEGGARVGVRGTVGDGGVQVAPRYHTAGSRGTPTQSEARPQHL